MHEQLVCPRSQGTPQASHANLPQAWSLQQRPVHLHSDGLVGSLQLHAHGGLCGADHPAPVPPAQGHVSQHLAEIQSTYTWSKIRPSCLRDT